MDGILIINFGTSHKESRKRTIDVFVKCVQEAFLDIPVYLAFTSKIILQKIYKQEGINIDTIEEALKRMHIEGITRVFIQPTYIFHEMKQSDIVYKHWFPDGIYIGTPLLSKEEDYNYVISVLFHELSMIGINVSRETLNTAIILIGHASNKTCPLEYYIMEKTEYKNIYVGAIEGYPDINTILNKIQEKGNDIKRIILIPFFFLMGKHALKDIAGIEEKSWKSKLERAGYKVDLVLKGIGEYPKIQKYYVKNLQRIINSFR